MQNYIHVIDNKTREIWQFKWHSFSQGTQMAMP